MSIQLVTPLIWALIDYYPDLEEKIYQNRQYLDKAFSKLEPPFTKANQESLISAVQNIDDNFFFIFDDKPRNIKAFIFQTLLIQNK